MQNTTARQTGRSTIRSKRLDTTAHPEKVFLARCLVAEAGVSWVLGNELIEDLKTIVSELMTNAIQVAEGAECVVLLQHDVRKGSVKVQVWDTRGDLLPRTQVAGPLMEAGRGLFIVQALCNGNCGWSRDAGPHGKWVWAEIGVSR